MNYNYKDRVAILVNGKIVKHFTVKQTTPCCDIVLSRWVVHKFDLEPKSFTLLKLGS